LQDQSEKVGAEESPKRQERARRILNAAAELVQRWGYKKTTIDDIARQAGVAKGTIYLHWKTREALFEALLTREWLIIARDFQQRLVEQPADVTLQSLTRTVVSIVLGRPLLKAFLAGDSDILGELVHSSTGTDILQMRLSMGQAYLEQLRSRGMIRTDIDPTRQLKILSAIAVGFLTIDQYLPEHYQDTAEEIADMLAETLHRTFAPEDLPPPEAVREVINTFQQQFEGLIASIQKAHPEIIV